MDIEENMYLSVAICSHNPRPDYLTRVLDALKAQTLPREKWEVLLIDNASDSILASDWNLSWHQAARHVRENVLGLTMARLRAIAEATGDVLVFVDDDNVLDENYLAECARIAAEMQLIGAWGGQQIGEFEVPPQEWMKPYLACLGVREFNGIRWSNVPHVTETIPFGAGLCVRAKIARVWSEKTSADPDRRSLGRTGNILNSCEDTDLALSACDEGYGMGVFPSLRLTHLIPKERLDAKYLARIIESSARSLGVLLRLRGVPVVALPNNPVRKCISLLEKVSHERRLRKMTPEARIVERAKLKGPKDTLKMQMGETQEPK